MAVVLQPGMAFRWKVDESAVFVCLASLKWGVLAWALKHHSMDAWRLDTSQIIEWKFILDVAQIEAAEAVPLLENESGVKVMLGNWEPVVKTALRLRSTRLTVLDLKIIGTVGFGMRDSEVDALLRLDLLKVLALKVGDQEFAEQVRLANVNKKSEDEGDDGWEEGEASELANMLFEMLDPSDMQEFRDLKDAVDKKEKAKKNRQWKQWQKEAEDVTGMKFKLTECCFLTMKTGLQIIELFRALASCFQNCFASNKALHGWPFPRPKPRDAK